MSSNQLIHALYDDDDVLLSAVKLIREKKHHIEEVYTPFPVHGLDKALGLDETRISIMAFIYGCIGFLVSILMMNYIMIEDWPQNIGGKPSFSYLENMPAFVPIMFEMTVFFAAHLMVITFYLRSKLWPFKEAENPNPLGGYKSFSLVRGSCLTGVSLLGEKRNVGGSAIGFWRDH